MHLVTKSNEQATQNRRLISIVLPLKNGAETIESCLRGIISQEVDADIEIIAIDSGSTDATYELLCNYPVRVYQIPQDEFNHGETRNYGVSLSLGDFVVMTVQDAIPADSHWLATILRHFDNPDVMGVCGAQIVPHDSNKNPLAWHRSSLHQEPNLIHFSNPEDFVNLPPATKRKLCGWDDVNAAYRRSAIVKIPFQKTGFCEDAQWARDALTAGYTLVYDPNAKVEHYHHETFSFRFRRTFTEQYHAYILFRSCSRRHHIVRPFLSAVYHLGCVSVLPLRQRSAWLAYNARLIMANWTAEIVHNFTLFLGGDAGLKRIHSKLCGKPPQAASLMPPTITNKIRIQQ